MLDGMGFAAQHQNKRYKRFIPFYVKGGSPYGRGTSKARRMARDKTNMLWVDGVSPEQKEQLKQIALKRFGKANASLMIRHLISECLSEEIPGAIKASALEGKNVRFEMRLPRTVLDELEKRAEQRISTRNYYIGTLIYEHLGQGQFQGDEVETLRRSNYDLAKIGTNLNQIAKAFNLLVLAGGGGKLPEIGKKIASLRTEIKSHTGKVLRVLESKTVVLESAQAARARAKPPKQKYSK